MTEKVVGATNLSSSIDADTAEKFSEVILHFKFTFVLTQVKDHLNVTYVAPDSQPKEILKFISKDILQSFHTSK